MRMRTLADLLDVAIQQEKDSQALYQHGLTLVEDNDAKNLLAKLVKEEIRHEATLTNIKATALYNLNLEIGNDAMFDKTGRSHGDNKAQNFDSIQTIEEILEIALRREYKAQMVFEAAADSAKDDELKDLMRNLAEEEKIHHREVDKQYRILKGEMGNELY